MAVIYRYMCVYIFCRRAFIAATEIFAGRTGVRSLYVFSSIVSAAFNLDTTSVDNRVASLRADIRIEQSHEDLRALFS